APGDLPARHEVDEARHRLPLVHGVGDHALEAARQADRLERALVGDAVGAGVVPVVENDLGVAQLAPDVDQVGCATRDARHLLEGLLWLGRSVDPDDPAWARLRGEAGNHAGLRAPRHRAHDYRVEEHAVLALLLLDLLGPAREAEAAQPVIRRA